jgi:hypothetical protein
MKRVSLVIAILLGFFSVSQATVLTKKRFITPQNCLVIDGADKVDYYIPWSIGFKSGATGSIALWCTIPDMTAAETVTGVSIVYLDNDGANGIEDYISAGLYSVANYAGSDVGYLMNGYYFASTGHGIDLGFFGWQNQSTKGWSGYPTAPQPFTMGTTRAYYWSVYLEHDNLAYATPLFKGIVMTTTVTF